MKIREKMLKKSLIRKKTYIDLLLNISKNLKGKEFYFTAETAALMKGLLFESKNRKFNRLPEIYVFIKDERVYNEFIKKKNIESLIPSKKYISLTESNKSIERVVSEFNSFGISPCFSYEYLSPLDKGFAFDGKLRSIMESDHRKGLLRISSFSMMLDMDSMAEDLDEFNNRIFIEKHFRIKVFMSKKDTGDDSKVLKYKFNGVDIPFKDPENIFFKSYTSQKGNYFYIDTEPCFKVKFSNFCNGYPWGIPNLNDIPKKNLSSNKYSNNIVFSSIMNDIE